MVEKWSQKADYYADKGCNNMLITDDKETTVTQKKEKTKKALNKIIGLQGGVHLTWSHTVL